MSIPVIDITDLSKYYGRARGIEHVNLQVGDGEIFGFIGPNGAGKSTTIRILLNLIFPSSGRASILGLDTIGETKAIKRLTGYIPSDASAYPYMDVGEFLAFCIRFHKIDNGQQRIAELSERFDLDPKRKIADLSMGNKKKVFIIQSLLHSPRLLILDEPTMGLDPLIQSRFFELLREENKRGMTIFYSSHILSEVQMLCKRVAIIKEGRIITIEDIETLRKKQLKKIHIEFGDGLEEKSFNVRGLEKTISKFGNTLTFLFSGKLDDLIGSLSERRIANMTIEEPSLEEIFMHYYS